MPLQKYALKTTAEHAGKRLDQVLAEWLPQAMGRPLSKSAVRRLIVAGAVYLNRKRVRIASKAIIPNAHVEAYVDPAKLEQSRPRDLVFKMGPDRILFEDDYLIVVDKPAGLPTQPTLDESRDNLFAAVKKYLVQKTGRPQAYVGLHHRLDRDTSGVVLFTKDPAVNGAVSDMFSKHLVTKTYQALTIRPAAEPGETRANEWKVKNYLGKAPGPGKKARFTAVRSGGDFAETDFRLLEKLPRGLLVEARPKTGRTHQIRVHLADGGMPILGDTHYGAPEGSASRVMLHARALTFPHPVHKTEQSVESPLPEDFEKCLQGLRNQ